MMNKKPIRKVVTDRAYRPDRDGPKTRVVKPAKTKVVPNGNLRGKPLITRLKSKGR